MHFSVAPLQILELFTTFVRRRTHPDRLSWSFRRRRKCREIVPPTSSGAFSLGMREIIFVKPFYFELY
jgi:hypothetical protein